MLPESKRDVSYWEGPDGVLKRATAFVYRRIIAPKEEGGDSNCGVLLKRQNKFSFLVRALILSGGVAQA